jgi:hypothetical protein
MLVVPGDVVNNTLNYVVESIFDRIHTQFYKYIINILIGNYNN